MDKQGIIASIKSEKSYLKEHFGVEEIALFGSYARDENTPESDVDILVRMQSKTLNNYFSLLDYLEKNLHLKVDLVTKHPDLSERFMRLINKDIIYV